MASAPPQDPPQQARPLRRTGPIIPRRIAPAGADAPPADLQAELRAERDALQGEPQAQGRRESVMPPRTGRIVPKGAILVPKSEAPKGEILLEPAAPAASALHAARPSAGEMLLHPFKTMYMVVALLVDRRVSIVRKLAFVVPIAVLALGLMVPETIFGILSGIAAPVVGLALDIPVDAAVDWVGLGLLAVALLGVFPAAVVAQYHAQLFHRKRGS